MAPESASGADPARTLVAVVGPTASGKSEWGVAIAEALDGEVIGADSRQVYRGLDIGTAKPSAEERARVPHHCLDHVDPRHRYSLAEYLQDARAALAGLRARGKRPLVVGGTGQYVWALLEGWRIPPAAPDEAFRERLTARAAAEGAAALHAELRRLDPEAAEAILPGNLRRIIRALEVYEQTGRPISEWQRMREPLQAVIVAPQIDTEELDRRIDERVVGMFRAGLLDEVRELLAEGIPPDAPGFDAIGYREALAALRGEISEAEAIAAAQRATRQFARRQRAWFRANDERMGWHADLEAALATVRDAPAG